MQKRGERIPHAALGMTLKRVTSMCLSRSSLVSDHYATCAHFPVALHNPISMTPRCFPTSRCSISLLLRRHRRLHSVCGALGAGDGIWRLCRRSDAWIVVCDTCHCAAGMGRAGCAQCPPRHVVGLWLRAQSAQLRGFRQSPIPSPRCWSVMAMFGLYNAVLPQYEAMALTALGTDSHVYGRIRLWGSLGFVLVAGSYGALLDHIGDSAFPWISLPLLLLATLAAWPHRNDEPPSQYCHRPPTQAIYGSVPACAASCWSRCSRRPASARSTCSSPCTCRITTTMGLRSASCGQRV